VALLLLLYGLYALAARSRYEILWNIALGTIMFAALLWFYTRRTVGGGDVKFVPVVCLWLGTHCVLIFSILLLGFIVAHLIAARMGFAPTLAVGERRAIPYAPSVSAALICIIALGCL
jgi:Flp pilus assembly protein protease CpaA